VDNEPKNLSADEDLNKLVRFWEEITLSPLGEALQRSSNYRIRREKAHRGDHVLLVAANSDVLSVINLLKLKLF
jgi:hypothetical protein